MFSWLFNFTWLAKYSTSRAPILKGLLPTLSTLFTLLAISLAVATGVWLWTGALATLTAFVPIYLTTIAGITGAALLNFFLARDITTGTLNCREALAIDDVHEETKDPVELYDLVNQVRAELSVYFKTDLPMPRICTYTSDSIKLHTTFGTSPENASLFFSSSFLNSTRTGWNKRHMAALVAHQMVQIHQRRGWSGTISSIATNFLSTLESLQESPLWYYRVLGILAGPLQFFSLVQKSIERSYSMAAITEVIGVGRGTDYFNAIDIKVSPSKTKKPAPPSQLAYYKEMKKRKPYDGWFSGIVRFFTDKMDDLEWIEDNKSGYRLIAFIRSMVREIIFSWQELMGSGNRTTREKDFIRESMKIGRLSKALPPRTTSETFQSVMEKLVKEGLMDAISPEEFTKRLQDVKWGRKLLKQPIETVLNKPIKDLTEHEFYAMLSVVCEGEMLLLDKKDREINAALYNQIPKADRYKCVGPNGDGHKTPFYESPDLIRLAKLKAKLAKSNGDASGNDDSHDDVLSSEAEPIITERPRRRAAAPRATQQTSRRRRNGMGG